MELRIGRDTLIALAAVVWADGDLAEAEAAGLRSAAKQLNLSEADQRAVDITLQQRITLDHVETVRMNSDTRLFTYVAASWLVKAKGHMDAKEAEALRLLGDRLGLSNLTRERADKTTELAAAKYPAGFDLLLLKSFFIENTSLVGPE